MGRSNLDSMDINDTINQLPEGRRRFFLSQLMDVLHDRLWCKQFAGGYVNPNVELAKANLYEELLEHRFIPEQTHVSVFR